MRPTEEHSPLETAEEAIRRDTGRMRPCEGTYELEPANGGAFEDREKVHQVNGTHLWRPQRENMSRHGKESDLASEALSGLALKVLLIRPRPEVL